MNWNCNSISGKRHHLELILNQQLNCFHLSQIKRYVTTIHYRLDRANAVGRGGVLIGVLDSSNIQVNNISPAASGELLAIDFSIGGFAFNLAVYYHRPAINNIDDFIAWHKTYSSCRQIIVGDKNLPDINWQTGKLKKRLNINMHKTFLNFLNTCKLSSFQHINMVTHSILFCLTWTYPYLPVNQAVLTIT